VGFTRRASPPPNKETIVDTTVVFLLADFYATPQPEEREEIRQWYMTCNEQTNRLNLAELNITSKNMGQDYV
jgi:hypothetical protein